MYKYVLTPLLLFILVGCNIKRDFDPKPVDYTFIAQGALGGAGKERIHEHKLVIENDDDWQTLISQMNSVNNESDQFKETDIDFLRYSIVILFDAVKPHGSTDFYVTEIIENRSTVNVYSQMDTPYFVMDVLSQAYYIVKMPKTDKLVVFEPTVEKSI